jgi:hypothetical protein
MSESGARTLHQLVSGTLAKAFGSSDLKIPGADATIRQGDRVAVIEVKTGDPDLPLPSSTSAQMLILADQARGLFGPDEVREVLPVLVTNYQISQTDRQELESQGIKIVPIASAGKLYNAANFSSEIANIVGFADHGLSI